MKKLRDIGIAFVFAGVVVLAVARVLFDFILYTLKHKPRVVNIPIQGGAS